MNRYTETNVWKSFDATSNDSECVEDMLGTVRYYERLARQAKWRGRFGFANRAGRASTEPQSSFRLGLSATIAIACVALSLLTLAYFAWQFAGRPWL